jgi:hypothetical protein
MGDRQTQAKLHLMKVPLRVFMAFLLLAFVGFCGACFPRVTHLTGTRPLPIYLDVINNRRDLVDVWVLRPNMGPVRIGLARPLSTSRWLLWPDVLPANTAAILVGTYDGVHTEPQPVFATPGAYIRLHFFLDGGPAAPVTKYTSE